MGRRNNLESDPPTVTASTVLDHLHCRLTFTVRGGPEAVFCFRHVPLDCGVRVQDVHDNTPRALSLRAYMHTASNIP